MKFLTFLAKFLTFLAAWVCFMLTLWVWSKGDYVNAGILSLCFVWNMRTLMKLEGEK